MATILKRAATEPTLKPNLADRLFLGGYLKNVRKALEASFPLQAGRAMERIRQLNSELLSDHRHLLVDRASHSHLVVVCILLASYRALSEVVSKDQALELTREPFLGTGKKAAEGMMSLMRWVTRDPFKTMVRISKTKQEAYYGRSFERSVVQDDDQAYVMRISKCFYHQFFAANDALELMPMFCAKDNNWSDAINPDKLGFRFDRPTTMGTGGAACEFRFSRVPDVELKVVS